MARVIKQADARALTLPGRLSREIVSGGSGADRVSFRIVEIAPTKPGETERGPHVHYTFEECIYVISGEGVTVTEKEELPVAAGDTILVPAGEVHLTRAVGDAPLKLLCFFPVADVAAGTKEFPDWDAARGTP